VAASAGCSCAPAGSCAEPAFPRRAARRDAGALSSRPSPSDAAPGLAGCREERRCPQFPANCCPASPLGPAQRPQPTHPAPPGAFQRRHVRGSQCAGTDPPHAAWQGILGHAPVRRGAAVQHLKSNFLASAGPGRACGCVSRLLMRASRKLRGACLSAARGAQGRGGPQLASVRRRATPRPAWPGAGRSGAARSSCHQLQPRSLRPATRRAAPPVSS